MEYFDQFQFGSSAPERSDIYLLSRLRLNTDLHVTPYFRVYAEGRSALSVDRDLAGRNSTGFYDQADLLNGFADIMIPFSKEANVTVKELTPRMYFEFDYASGDKKRGGGVGTFNQLYPNGHSYLGYIDYIGRQNVISPSAGVSLSPLHDLTLSLQQCSFWRASDRDALYNKSGAVLRPGTTTTARYVGAETDLLGNLQLHAPPARVYRLQPFLHRRIHPQDWP